MWRLGWTALAFLIEKSYFGLGGFHSPRLPGVCIPKGRCLPGLLV